MSEEHGRPEASVEVMISPCSLPFRKITGLPEEGLPGQYLGMTGAGARWKELPADLAKKEYVDSALATALGDIAAVLDAVNGEVV